RGRPFVVIPAKAGIQSTTPARPWGWTPAFAGVTITENASKQFGEAGADQDRSEIAGNEARTRGARRIWPREFEGKPMFNMKKVEIEWGGKTLTLETGRVARQADGAVLEIGRAHV